MKHPHNCTVGPNNNHSRQQGMSCRELPQHIRRCLEGGSSCPIGKLCSPRDRCRETMAAQATVQTPTHSAMLVAPHAVCIVLRWCVGVWHRCGIVWETDPAFGHYSIAACEFFDAGCRAAWSVQPKDNSKGKRRAKAAQTRLCSACRRKSCGARVHPHPPTSHTSTLAPPPSYQPSSPTVCSLFCRGWLPRGGVTPNGKVQRPYELL